jgi:gamma-glutamyltranspeptidase/glutathione hydrolase
VRVIDERLPVAAAVKAPRVHFEDGIVYTEPGVDEGELEQAGRAISRFGALNLFFGGVQAVAREPDGSFGGAGDPRRGGAAIMVED